MITTIRSMMLGHGWYVRDVFGIGQGKDAIVGTADTIHEVSNVFFRIEIIFISQK